MTNALSKLLRSGACFKYDRDNANYLDEILKEIEKLGGRLKINTKPYLDKFLSKERNKWTQSY